MPRGLSPPVRGNPTGQPCRRLGMGSIPACAGEPIPFPPFPFPYSVYPRLCGGTSTKGLTSFLGQGLSPPVRGNRLGRCGPSRRPRSIPACAGEPLLAKVWREEDGVYPRLCGGTSNRKPRRHRKGGLSPPVRGNLAAAMRAVNAWGSIPACAGEPSAGWFAPR